MEDDEPFDLDLYRRMKTAAAQLRLFAELVAEQEELKRFQAARAELEHKIIQFPVERTRS